MMQNMMMGYGGVAQEEITTIFVVGFPSDMQEREFQNMFIFSPGFEAATLKIPLMDDEEHTGHKKQIIGFAKFRTRLQALEARDILSGRKVDAEKGCVLKAEMAKKNLHTKRGLSNEFFHPAFQQYNMVNMGMAMSMLPQLGYQPTTNDNLGLSTSGSSTQMNIPPMRFRPDLLCSGSMLMSGQDNNSYLTNNGIMNGSTISTNNLSDIDNCLPEYTRLEYLNSTLKDAKQSSPPSLQNLFDDAPESVASSPTPTSLAIGGLAGAVNNTNTVITAVTSSTDSPVSLSSSAGKSVPVSSRMSILTSQYPGDYLSINHHAGTQDPNILSSKKLSVNINLANSLANKAIQNAAVLPSPTTPMINFDAPAFQYKPANTLYIGQLPSNISDQDLRAHMSFCEGFKRILYSGSSGVYIEFTSEEYANDALTELRNKYGLSDVGTLSTASDAKMSQINASFNFLRSATL